MYSVQRIIGPENKSGHLSGKDGHFGYSNSACHSSTENEDGSVQQVSNSQGNLDVLHQTEDDKENIAQRRKDNNKLTHDFQLSKQTQKVCSSSKDDYQRNFSSNGSSGVYTSGYESETFANDLKHRLTGLVKDSLEKRTLTRNYIYLREALIADELCDYLEQECVISNSEGQTIRNEKNLQKQAELLLLTLLQKPTFDEEEYEHFFRALRRSDNAEIAERLNIEKQQDEEIPNEDIDMPGIREFIEEHLEFLSEQIDTPDVAPMCLQMDCISIHDYAEIFPDMSIIKKSAKTLLTKIVAQLPNSLPAFRRALHACESFSALKVLDQYNQYNQSAMKKRKVVKVQCTESIEAVTVKLRNGVKFTIEMGDSEVESAAMNEIKLTTTSVVEFTSTTHTECIQVEQGSIILYLKTYDNELVDQLINSQTDHKTLCKLIESIILQEKVLESTDKTSFKIKLTIDEFDVDRTFLGEANETDDNDVTDDASPMLLLKMRKSLICRHLNPNKYRKAMNGVMGKHEELIPVDIKSTSREAKMEVLMDVILADSSLCDHFFNLVHTSEEQEDLFDVVSWNGTTKQICMGIRDNFKYLVDGLIPSKVVSLLNMQDIDHTSWALLQETLRTDRRTCAIMLLKCVLKKGNTFARPFYNALCNTHPIETACRIRRSGIECKTTSTEDNSLRLLTDSRLMECEFTVHIDCDKSLQVGYSNSDRRNRESFVSSKPFLLRKWFSDRTKYAQGFQGQGSNSEDIDGANHCEMAVTERGVDSWETTSFSTDIQRKTGKAYNFSLLKKEINSIIDVSISHISGKRKIIIQKTEFDDQHVLSIEITKKNTCIINSSLLQSIYNLQDVSNLMIYIRGYNLKIEEKGFIKKADEMTFRNMRHLKRKAATFSGKKYSKPRKSVLDRPFGDVEHTPPPRREEDEGYRSAMPSSLSSSIKTTTHMEAENRGYDSQYDSFSSIPAIRESIGSAHDMGMSYKDDEWL